MTWFNGDGTPDNFTPGDPMASAAAEMAATQALVSAGPAISAPAQIQKALAPDPHAGMTREEKIARIEQLVKARKESVQKHEGPASEDSTHPEEHNASDSTGIDQNDADQDVEDQGKGKTPLAAPKGDELEKAPQNKLPPMHPSKKVKKPEKTPEQRAEESAAREDLNKAATAPLLDWIQKAGTTTLPARVPIERPGPEDKDPKKLVIQKSTEGEGSRGGKVIGHTSAGDPIYADQHGLAAEHHRRLAEHHEEKSKEHYVQSGAGRVEAYNRPGMKHGDRAEEKRHAQQAEAHRSAAKEHRLAAAAHSAAGDPKLHPSQAPGSSKFAARASSKANKHTLDFHRAAAEHHKLQKERHEQAAGYAGGTKEEAENHWGQMAYHRKVQELHEQAVKKKQPRLEAFSKSMPRASAPSLAALIQKSEASRTVSKEIPMNAASILNEYLQKAEGQGDLPEAGDPPSSLPESRRAVDGGDVDGAGKAEGPAGLAAAGVAETAGKPDVPSEQELGEDPEGGSLRKGNFIDWDQAKDQGEFLRAQLTSQLMNKSMDIRMGGAPAKRPQAAPSAPRMPQVVLQKGSPYVYVDVDDEAIEKAFNRIPGGGTTFTQVSAINLGAPVQHDVSCGHCGGLTKSFLSSCNECGEPLRKSAPMLPQGLYLEKSVGESLLPSADDDIVI